MDINAVLSQARKNKKECNGTTINRYNTNVKPAKKLPRPNVDPNAIKAFLEKKKQDEVQNLVAAQKKKEGLVKLRDATKSTKKANAMARRTKDNLKVYKGEDVLGLYPEPKVRRRHASPLLSPEADRKHKAFMKNMLPKVRVPGINDDDSDDGYKEPVLEQDERKRRKMEKNRAKARSASNLEFSDLLQLAEKQKNKADESSSSTSEDSGDSEGDSDDSTDNHGKRLTPEEKYQRERKKRRELEERLKAAASQKGSTDHHSKEKHKSPKGLSGFKIGKLNSSLSEETKRAKAKALAEKLRQSSQSKRDSDKKLNPSKSKERDEKGRETSGSSNVKSEKIKKSHSTPNLTAVKDKSFDKRPEKVKHRESRVKSERPHIQQDRNMKHLLSKPQRGSSVPSGSAPSKQPPSSKSINGKTSQSQLKQTDISNHFKATKRKSTTLEQSSPSSSKIKREKPPISNPYRHTVVNEGRGLKRPVTDNLVDPWAKSSRESNTLRSRKAPPAPAKCTLSVTCESVKTNYPGVAQLDPYIQAYKKTGKVVPKLTPEMMARYKAAIMRKMQQQQQLGRSKQPPPGRRRYGVIGDDSDEYDSELEDFIVDEEEEMESGEVDVSSHIKAIFGYDKNKYGRESEWELSRMEASYKDIEKEEKRSLKIAREEDAKEAKLEEERMKRLTKKKR